MKKILLSTVLLYGFTSHAQVGKKPEQTGDLPAQKDVNHMMVSNPGETDKYGVYYYAGLDEKPSFPGGEDTFENQIASKISIDKYKDSDSIGLNIWLAFIIEVNGTISNIEVLNGHDAATAKEAVDAAKAIKTKWVPGKYNGKTVRTGVNTLIFVPFNKSDTRTQQREISENVIEVIDLKDTGTDYAVEPETSGDNEPVNFAALQVKPEFPGGISVFQKYITDNIKKENLVEGAANKELKVYVSFIVEKDGTLTKPQILRDPGYGLGKEVVRIITGTTTKWSPGIQNGKPVRTHYILPIVCKIPQ